MAHLNPFKIYSSAILYLILPRKLGCYFYFIKKTPAESLAIGTVMTRITYIDFFRKKSNKKKELHFTNKSTSYNQ